VKRDGQVVQYAPTFHSLRHTHASALIADGMDVAEVSARLGHADVETTLRAYMCTSSTPPRGASNGARGSNGSTAWKQLGNKIAAEDGSENGSSSRAPRDEGPAKREIR
jgi:hypothetical protein